MQIKYEIFNILLAQHNKFQYNAGEAITERGKWSIAGQKDSERRTKDRAWSFLGRCSSIFEESSPFRPQFEFHLEQTVQLDLTCAFRMLFLVCAQDGFHSFDCDRYWIDLEGYMVYMGGMTGFRGTIIIGW